MTEFSKDELRDRLTEEQFRVTQEAATEAPFSGEYLHVEEDGMFHCVVCHAPLFSSEKKYDSGSGWPSFTDPESKESLEFVDDQSHGMVRTEVRCRNCGSHLGHVFPDGPTPGCDRYCINSAALKFEEE